MCEKRFYLTFDGAPNPPGTDKILQVLAHHAVPAAFFMEGRRLETEAECARRVRDAGHDVGNHTYNHPTFDAISLAECLEEVTRTDDILEAELGRRPTLLRPPFGILTPATQQVLLERGYTIVLWSVSIRDWEGPDAGAIAQRLLQQVRDGAIVVFHDHVPWNPDALDIVIPALRDQGYTFGRISEIARGSGIIR
ncbi:MAG TPA: polysaccharide deacetylase family protein [Candidatus Sulfomarinibacteraceae bacterium]|nr:polysaccharide deacetylase family protein [Candidatus Sulfomarinibacteraceae bacterium]